MNIQSQYQKVLSGQLSKEGFMNEALSDPRFKGVISRMNTYDDMVNILKTRGYIVNEEQSQIKPFDFLGTVSRLNEGVSFDVPERKKPEMDVDHVNYYEFQKGWRHELMSCKGDIQKAKEKALKNINEDDIYYTRLEMGTKKPKDGERDDVMINLSKKGTSMNDEKRAMKPVKGVEKIKSNTSEKSTDPKAKKNPEGVKTMKKGSPTMKTLKESLDDSDKKKVEEAGSKLDPKDSKLIDKLIKAVNILIDKGFDKDGDPLQFADTSSTWEEEFSYKPVVRKGNVITFTSNSPYSNHGKDIIDRENINDWGTAQDAIGTLRFMIRGYKKAYKKAGVPLPTGTQSEPKIEDDKEISEKKKPSAGLTKKEKSAIVKKAVHGKDIGKKGKGFEDVAKKAEKKYGSKEKGEKVAAAAMWKNAAKAKMHEAEAGKVIFSDEQGSKSVEVRDLGYVDGKKMFKVNKTENGKSIGTADDVAEDQNKAIEMAKAWVKSTTEETQSPESNIKDLKKKYANPANPAVISFTFEDPSKGGEVVQYEGRVKDIVKSKTPGAYVLKMDDNASIAVMKDRSGKPTMVYMPKDGKDPIKNPDINTDDAKIIDDILGISKEKVDEQGPVLGEDVLSKIKEAVKSAIKKHLKEYAEGEEDDYNDIEDTYGTPEIKNILKKYDYLGFDLPGEAMNAILTDKDWKNGFDMNPEKNSEVDSSDISKIDAWRKKHVAGTRFAEDANQDDGYEDISEDYTNDKIPLKVGPKVKMSQLKHELRNMTWEALNSENAYQRQINTERLNKIMRLVDELGDEGKEVYNQTAPDDMKIKEANQVHQEIKDLEDMRPEDVADMVLKQDFNPHSIKTKAAAMIIGNALKQDKGNQKLKDAFIKLADIIKK